MSKSELACVYAALILHDDGADVTADNIATIVKSAGIEVEPYWPTLFARLVQKKSIDQFIVNVGAGGGAAPAAGGAAPAAGGAAPAAAAKEDEPEEEEEEDMGFSLFD